MCVWCETTVFKWTLSSVRPETDAAAAVAVAAAAAAAPAGKLTNCYTFCE